MSADGHLTTSAKTLGPRGIKLGFRKASQLSDRTGVLVCESQKDTGSTVYGANHPGMSVHVVCKGQLCGLYLPLSTDGYITILAPVV